MDDATVAADASVTDAASTDAGTALGPTRGFVETTLEAGLRYQQAPVHQPGGTDWYAHNAMPLEPPAMTGGAAAADYDGDGFVDLYVTRLHEPGILFRNNGDGTFEDVTELEGLAGVTSPTVGAAFGDIDNDGDPDLYLTTLGATRFLLFINDREAGFSEQGQSRGAAIEDADPRQGFSASFGDYDRDGFLDLHTCEWQWNLSPIPASSHSRLLHNRGAEGAAFAGRFEDVTASAGVMLTNADPQGVHSFASSFSDLDGDGLPELVVAADWGTSRLFWNDGDGTFTDGTQAAGVGLDDNGMGSTIGDYDGDGDLDWFVTAIHCASSSAFSDCPLAGNRLYRNDGDRTFSEIAAQVGIDDGDWGWGASFLDFDNDGDLDLAMTNGIRFEGRPFVDFRSDPTRIWENDGSGGMRDVTGEVRLIENGDGKGLLVLDYDRDGDLDIFIVDHVTGGRLFRNEIGNRNDWLRIELRGTSSNRQGIGARVSVTKVAGGRTQVRELRGGNNFLGQNEPVLHFGLGANAGPVAEVRIRWPHPGGPNEQVLTDVAPNQVLQITEP